MLMELITCGVLYFFNLYILTARSAGGGGGKKRTEVSTRRVEQTLMAVGN